MHKTTGVSRRLSQHINRRVTQSILRAFDFTAGRGQAFNLYVVINLREGGDDSMGQVFRIVLHKYRDWLAYLRKQGDASALPSYASTLENPAGTHPHVNWVLFVPPHLVAAFRRKLPQWVNRAIGAEVGPFDIKVQEIVPGTEKSLAKYILKGTDPEFVPHFYLERVAEPQGTVWGRRAGMSLSVGRAAREAAGFRKGRRPWLWSAPMRSAAAAAPS